MKFPELTRLEKQALIIISGLILLSFLFQFFRLDRSNPTLFDYSLPDSVFRVRAADTANSVVHQPLRDGKPGAVVYPVKAKQELRSASIDLNRASKTELQKLPGIGPSTAQAIIDFREKNGPFRTMDDLDRVPRIGKKTIEKLSPFIRIDKDTTKAD